MQAVERSWRSPEEDHLGRLRIAYRAASVALIALSAAWLAMMLMERQWALVVLNACEILSGLFLLYSIDRRSFRLAAALVHLFLFLVIAEVCLIYDVPSATMPRVTHLYFLAMAFLFYVTFRQVSIGMTHAVVLAYLGCFVLFSSTAVALPSATPLPDGLRAIGGWVHSTVALGIMCMCIQIMQADYASRTSFGRQIATALAESQFELYLQPQVGLDNSVHGAEALLRWNHPRRGLVPPGEFIPAAEQMGIMRPIGKWVLEAACARLSAWQRDPERAHLRLAVNISPQQFADSDFVPELKGIVARHGIDPGRLELELTEGVVVNDPEDVIAKMDSLVAFGVGLSLDDFGTGYSSLRYLKRMPFTQLKIDQGFVRDMLGDERDAVIVKGIIQLGRELRLTVIAEGVETRQQKDFLIGLGCTAFQGYLFGRPMPARDFARLPMRGLAVAA